MSKKLPTDLRCQALRLPGGARALLDAATSDLKLCHQSSSSPAEVVRGLVHLGLYCLHGSAGARLAQAFRLAATDPTEEGVCRALDDLKAAQKEVAFQVESVDEAPLTEPEPRTKASPRLPSV
jgi:hypothetical protein